MGDVTDLSNFMGAVIDERAFDKHKKAIARAKRSSKLDDHRRRHRSTTRSATSSGRLVSSRATRPTRCSSTEYFGPILAVHVYDDSDFEAVVDQMESFAPYALTGAVIAQDRAAIAWATRAAALRGGQLLHQRQADRRGRRPAAVRRRPRLRHQRQGRRGAEPDALDVAALDQGDVRAAEGLPLPAHGLTVWRAHAGAAAADRPRADMPSRLDWSGPVHDAARARRDGLLTSAGRPAQMVRALHVDASACSSRHGRSSSELGRSAARRCPRRTAGHRGLGLRSGRSCDGFDERTGTLRTRRPRHPGDDSGRCSWRQLGDCRRGSSWRHSTGQSELDASRRRPATGRPTRTSTCPGAVVIMSGRVRPRHRSR